MLFVLVFGGGVRLGVVFRDRSLKPSERYHHYCSECGAELHSDLAYSHKCGPLVLGLKKRGGFGKRFGF